LHDICFVAIATDATCTFVWAEYHPPRYFAVYSRRHSGASTLRECRKACEFDPRCVSIDWLSVDRECWINTDPNHLHQPGHTQKWKDHGVHYHLVSRCNITSGRCHHDVLYFYSVHIRSYYTVSPKNVHLFIFQITLSKINRFQLIFGV